MPYSVYFHSCFIFFISVFLSVNVVRFLVEAKPLTFGDGDEDDITDIHNLGDSQDIADYLSSAGSCVSLANLSATQVSCQ